MYLCHEMTNYRYVIVHESHWVGKIGFRLGSGLNTDKMQQNIIWYLIHVNMVPKGGHAQAKSNLDMIKLIESRCTQLNI